MNANLLYETVNYAWAMVSAFMIAFLIRYLYDLHRESGWQSLFDRPQSEQLAVAILFADGGNMIDRLARGAWRTIGGDLQTVNMALVALILIGSTFGMLGVLCKLRVVSIARHGHWPWVTCASITLAFVVGWVTHDVVY